MKYIFAALSVFIFASAAFCENANFPDYSGYVNDYAGILSNETKAKLAALSSEIEAKTTSQLAILEEKPVRADCDERHSTIESYFERYNME